METPTEVIIGEDGKQYVVPKSKLRGFVDGVQGGAPPDPSMLPPDEGPTYEMGDTPVPPTPKQGPPPAMDEPPSAGPAQAQAATPPTLGTPGQPPSWMPGPGPQVSFAPPPAPQAPPPLGTPGQPPPVEAPAPPMQKKPGTLQRIGAGLLGGAAGYVNAAGRSHIDQSTVDDATQGILQPGYGRDTANYQMKRQAAADKSKLGLEDAQAKSSLENAASNTEYREASAAQRKAAPGIATAKNVADAEAKRQATNEKLEQTMLKPWGDDAQLQKEGDPVAPGMEVTQSLTQPGMVWIHPPRMVPLPKGLADFAPGRTVGDLVPYSEFKKIQDRANENQIKNTNKPDPALRENPNQWQADALSPDPAIAAAAKAKLKGATAFAIAGRPVNNNFMNSDSGKTAIEETAQGLAHGDLSRLRDISSMRGDQRLQIYARAKQINPSFNTAELDRKIKMKENYDNGKGADSLRSFGTFLEHGGAAIDAANAIGQSNPKLLNKPINWWKQNMSGDPAFQSFLVALEPVGKEFESFLLSGRALYEDDRKQIGVLLDPNSSLAQTKAALKTMGHTAGARFTEENYKYKRLMKQDLEDPFSPEAAEGARKMGVSLGTSAHVQGSGNQGNAGGGAGGGTVRVKRKADGVTGTIDAKDFNPAKYDRVQ